MTLIMAAALLPMRTFAGTEAPAWLEERMYASGKIGTVVIVASVVLLGIAGWMFTMDRRLGKLEKNMDQRKTGGPSETK
jgi:hypothetical protein